MNIFKNTIKKTMKGQITNEPFEIIKSSDILTELDLSRLNPLKQELVENFKKSQVFRTRTEMEVSVLNDLKFPSPASKYWQSVREQNVMFTELANLSYEYRKKLVEIKILKRDIEIETDELQKELKEIELEKEGFALIQMEKVAQDRIREIEQWSDIKEREAKQMTVEQLEDVDNHQLVSYTQRWIRQAIAMGNNGSPAERQNLLGQLESGLKVCKKNNLLGEVKSGLSLNEEEILESNL